MPHVGEHSERLATIEYGWEDLRFPASAINPIGGVSAPSVISSETGLPGALSFSGTQDEMIAGLAQMPHGWRSGTPIKPHIHWLKPTGSANAVTWEFYYRRLGSVGDTAEAWTGPVAGTLAAGTQTTSDNHLITSFGPVTMTGLRESCMLAWRIYRLGSTDAETNAVTLLEFDIHYERVKAGTAKEFPA